MLTKTRLVLVMRRRSDVRNVAYTLLRQPWWVLCTFEAVSPAFG